MSDAQAQRRVRIHKVRDDDDSVLEYLGDRGLIPGRMLTVKEVRTLDGVVTVEDEDGETHSFGAPVARQVFVRPTR